MILLLDKGLMHMRQDIEDGGDPEDGQGFLIVSLVVASPERVGTR